MRILILNGDTRPKETTLARYLADFETRLSDHGALVRRIDLADLDLKFCTGCWSCWLATPGRCVFRDGMEGVYPEFLASDLVVWASPLVLGTVPALVKKTQDRLIPLVHPYIQLVHGECHHRKRYDRYPDLGLIVAPESADMPEDLRNVRHLFERFALNLRADLRLFATVDSSPEESVDAALAS